ncbi:hypothetical protein [Hymenobacter rigui]|uniref:Uncharacterized protein n=1 Tax=Hymenobacter rigui TaxID=334424 RepID=A0A3R9NNJ8_9BACT|nr:hypothetical protein [Hymenobacter rigui]RSK51144.1 hypothetical protein EI291_02175 [Hymenobacter rigui]
MEKSEDKKKDKLLYVNKLSQKNRQKVLFEAFIDYPTGFGYRDRIRDMAVRANVKPAIIFQHARRHDWENTLAQVLEAQKQEEAFAQALDSANPLEREIPLSTIANKVKGLSWLLLTTARTYVQATAYMIQYYAARIARVASEAGGFHLLSSEELAEVKGYQIQLQQQAKQLEPYMKPGAITALLSSINFSQQIPDDSSERDTTAFTIASLTAKMRELGMLSAFDNPSRAVQGFTDEPLPILSGHVNQDNNSPISFQDGTTPGLI